jgi:hypothetical protein
LTPNLTPLYRAADLSDSFGWNWEAANAGPSPPAGRLVIINSKEENDFIVNNLSTSTAAAGVPGLA